MNPLKNRTSGGSRPPLAIESPAIRKMIVFCLRPLPEFAHAIANFTGLNFAGPTLAGRKEVMIVKTLRTHSEMPRPRRAAGGFTLVELMVVMGIIAMILGLSVPVFAVIMQGRSIRGAVDVTQGVFLKYREKATTSGKPIFLVFEHWEYPCRFKAWYVEKDPNVANRYLFRSGGDDTADLPEVVNVETEWRDDVNFSVPAGISYFDEANALCTQNDSPYKFNDNQAPHGGKAYFFIFTPDGSVMILGRPNVPSFAVEGANDGDIILTNGDTRMCIDINPATGRVRWGERDY